MVWDGIVFPFLMTVLPTTVGSVHGAQSHLVPDSPGAGLQFPEQDSWDDAGAIPAEEQNI